MWWILFLMVAQFDEVKNAEKEVRSSSHTVFLSLGSRSEIGVLVLAHGGTAEWEEKVLDAVQPVAKKYPVAVAFGMAMRESKYIQDAVGGLSAAGVEHLLVFPLFISSSGPLPRHLEYLFGLQKETVFPLGKTGELPHEVPVSVPN